MFLEQNPITFITQTYLSRPPGKGGGGWVCSFSLGFIALLSLIYWNAPTAVSYYMPAIPEQVFVHHEYWRLLTAIFIHADVQHLLSNMFLFGIFAYLLYAYFGFFVYPLGSFALGAVVNYFSLLTYLPRVQLLGASGVVYLMAGIWLVLYFLIERRYTPIQRIIRCVGFSLVVLAPSTFNPLVSYRTHAIGFIVGMFFGVIYFYRNKVQIRAAEVYVTEEF